MLNRIHVCLALVTFHSVGISTAAFESQTSSYLEVTLEKMSLNVQAKRTWILFGFTEEEFAQIHANAEAPFQSFLDFEKMEEVLSRDEELTLIGKDEQLNKFGQLQKALIGRRPRRVMVFVGRDAALDKLEDYEPIGFELEIYQEQVDPGKLAVHFLCPLNSLEKNSNLWQKSRGLLIKNRKCANPLKGKEITVSVVGIPPFILYTETGIEGADIDILRAASRKLGFTYRFKYESYWIDVDGNGTVTGMVGSVLNGLSSIGLGNAILSSDFYQLVDATPLLYMMECRLISPKPKPIKPYLNLLKPFTPSLWVVIFGSLVLTVALYFVLNITHGSRERIADIYVQSTQEIFMVLCSQSTISKSKGLSSTLLLSFWTFFVFLIVASYECNLRAYLMVVDFERVIDSDQDMVDLGRPIYLPEGTPFLQLYLGSPDPAQRALGKQVELNKKDQLYIYDKGLMPIEKEREMIKYGGATVLTDSMALAQFPIIEKRHGYQPFRLSKGVSIIFVGAHLIPKRAPFEKDLGKAMQEIVEAGLVTFYKRRYISPKYLTGSEEISKQASPTAFTLLHIMGALVILLGGLAVATLAFMVEVSRGGKGKGTLRAGKKRFCLRFIERAVE